MHFPACLEDTEVVGTQALQARSHKSGVGPRATSHLGLCLQKNPHVKQNWNITIP